MALSAAKGGGIIIMMVEWWWWLVADVLVWLWYGGRRMFIGILMDVPAISAERRR
jgi:hypothetical protein